LLIALEVKTESLKFAILFMVADMCWVIQEKPEDQKT